ncbi:hypothetical protein CJD36_003475 [Flavipsychrobacter stenotrophus]|uniref:Uncharacterized protein n=1 Tax=Flavipsychrobacter stenotrophus TaxID=2077091 RepID=A0A2S7T1L3_9BACT|nr:FG-GAP-like repeat-containing protein [Flavipsychrobacter stenotrophus]PQJ12818.1 hypothetical protein CJD36_003475 [Flavipsychrobacter stenotrophus]
MKANMYTHTLKIFLLTALALLLNWSATAQYTWSGASGGAWSTTTNWNPSGTPTGTAVAQFSTAPTGTPTVTTSGTTTAGALYVLSSRTTSLSITGTLITLSGATISSSTAVVVANLGSNIFNIACPLANGSAKTYLTAGGTSSLTTGPTISISGAVSGNGANTFLGGGTWDGSTGVCGGILRFSGANTFTGTLAVGSSVTTTGNGILEFGASGSASSSLVINNYSQLSLASAGTYAAPLTLNGIGNGATTSNYGRGAIRSGAIAPVWNAAVTLSSNSVIYVGATGSLTMGLAVSGSGQLIKEGTGLLILSGNAGSLTFAGGLKISEGSVSITKNGSLANPIDVVLSQINGNSTSLSLSGSTAQTVNSLSSIFSGTSGTITQTLALGSNCSLTINQSANTTFGYGSTTSLSLSSIITGGSSSSIIKTGTGSLTFNGWPHTFTGGVTIANGSIILAPAATITTSNAFTLSGGTLATTGITNAAVCSLGVLNNVSNSTIALDASQAHTLRFASLNTNTGVITITGWQGAFDGTTGTKGKIIIGTSATLTSPQLAQFQFQDSYGNIIPAAQITGGEVVPKISLNIVAASYGPFYNNVDNTISVSYNTTATFFTGNFRIQLSSSTGTFANTTSNIIGTAAWSSSGTITATIASGTAVGALYRVRLLSTSPYVIATTDNGTNISLGLPVPNITSLSAYNHVLPGTTITISGSNFNTTAANNIVYFGAVKSTATSVSPTVLSVTVPFGATYSQLTVYDTITKSAGSSNFQFLPAFDASFFVADTIKFLPRVDYTTGNNPVIAAIGDLDGDGLPDMVALNKTGASLKILQNQGTGVSALTMSNAMTLQGSGPLNVKIADIDGDGRNDIVVAGGSGSPTVQIFRNLTNYSSSVTPRTLVFDTRVNVTVPTVSTGVLAISDLDGDGKLDIAAACYDIGGSIGKLVILKNGNSPGSISSGAFTFYSYNTGTVYRATSSAIAIGDFNGDLLPDIAVTNMIEAPVPASVSVFKNASTPNAISFASAITVPTGAYLIDIVAVDVDGDLKQDLIVSEALDSTVSVFRNTCTSPASALSFASRQVIANLATPAGLAVGDLDADGKPDIAVASFLTTGVIALYKNTSTSGTPSFVNINNLPAARYPTGINIGDIDKDGYPDIVVGNTSFDTSYVGTIVSVYRNTPLPIVGTISSASDSICIGATTSLNYSLSLPTGETGAWSSSNTSIATVSPSGIIYGVAAGTVDISYTVTVTRGSISRSVSRTIVIKPLPVVNITGYRGVCQGVTTTLTGAPSGGLWAHSNAVTSVTSTGAVTGVGAAGTDIISYTYTSPVTGCSNADTQAMPIISPPNPGTISGADSICPGASTTMTTSGDIGGKWFSDNFLFASVDSLTGILTGQNTGSPIINYKIANGCGIFNSYKAVNVLPLPDAGAITGPSSVCSGADISLNNPVTGGTWSSNNTAQATVSAAGIVSGVAVGSPVISYTKSNSCGSSSATLGIIVNTVPSAPSAISGNSSVCIGSATSLSSATVGGLWTSSNISLATINSSTGIATGIVVGTPQISYTVSNSCGSSAPALMTLNVLGTPNASITSAIVPCDGYSSNIIFTGTPGDVVSYSVDGGANIDGTLTGGTFNLPTGIITSTHTYLLHTVRNVACAILKDTTVTLIPQQMTWLGGASGAETSWATAANWSCGSIPLTSDNVLIPHVVYVPVISATAYSKNLTVSSLAGLSINGGGSINIKGNLLNQGIVNGSGTVILNGTTLQTITGKGTVSNLDLNNSSGATIDTGSHVLITGALSVSAGTFNTNDSLELASTDSVSTARIAALPASGALITGKVKVDQYVVAGYRRYRFVSHPFSDTISLGQIQTYIDITGPGGSANGFRSTSSNAPSAFRLDPSTGNSSLGYDPGWKPFTKINNIAADTNKFHPGQGLRIFFRGAKGEGLGYLGYSGGYVPSATTFKMMGHVNQGPLTLRLSKGTVDPGNQEFNMVGNPYPSPIDIGTIMHNAWVSNQVVGSAFYVWDPTMSAGGQFVTVSIGTSSATPYYIQANTAFQVRAHHDGAIISFDESNKSATSSGYLFREPAKFVALNVYDANYHLWDMLKFNFIDAATDNDDEKYDATKLLSSDFSFSSKSADGKKLSIDARPYVAENTIPLEIHSNYMQDFIIRADNVAVPNDGSIVLHDKLLQKYIVMTQGAEYKFTISNDKTNQGDRFELALKSLPSASATGLSIFIDPNPATSNVNIHFKNNTADATSVNIIDMNGVNIYSQSVAKTQNGSLNVSLDKFAPGLYMVEIIHGNERVAQKLIKE